MLSRVVDRLWVRERSVAGLIVAAVLGLAACGSGSASRDAEAPLPTGPAALRQLKNEGAQLLDGGVSAFEARVASLRGYPIVVNQWASWCGPCREEFPIFQRLAKRHEGKVAFLGVDSQDNREDAAEFLEEFPTPFPHYYDRDAEIARTFRGGRAWPTTAFYDRHGELVKTKLGAYATADELEHDIEEHALAR